MKIFLKVKPFQETLYMSYCGPATLKILFSCYGIDKSEKELAKMAGWDKEIDIDEQGTKKAVGSLGFKVKIKNSIVYGLDNKFIYLQDPEIGKIRKIERDDFTRVWFDFKGEYLKPDELVIRQIIAIYR